MNSDKCKALNREGKPCERNAMKNSQYCWSHSFGRFKKTQWYRNATVQVVIIPLAIALLFFLIQHAIQYHWHKETADKDTQDRMESKINRILDGVRDYDEENYAELIERYPLGYVYIAYNFKDKSTKTLDSTQPTLEYTIQANSMKVVSASSRGIDIALPNIVDKRTGNILFGNVVGFSRTVGTQQRVPFGMPVVRMWFELLVDDSERFICLIGFREEETTDE